MSEAYLGEIKMFASNFAPVQWAMCNGALLATSQNQALFSLLGTFYGGDGRSSYGLPDLRGRIPIHFGQGPGLTPRPIGQRGGHESNTLTTAHLPPHNHTFQVSGDNGNSNAPNVKVIAKSTNQLFYEGGASELDPLNSSSVGNTGGEQAYDNHMPWLAINFIICITGIYPSRN